MKLFDYGNSVIRGVDMAEFINRDLHELLIRMAGWFPVVSLTGPRQSGKSTLVRHAFPDYSYVTLEDPQTRRAALEDPVSFIRNRKGGLIIDEAQNLTPKQMKALITRAGPGTKIVCMGNLAQIDTPYLTEGSSGLTFAVDRFKGWPHSGHITLARGERSRLADFASEVL